MTLLLTNDLNGNFHWFEWVVRNAARVDAVCISGDLVNPLRGSVGSQRELAESTAWAVGVGGVGFFACEGDRDLWGTRWQWLKSLSGTRCEGRLAVTSLPWRSRSSEWFVNANRWRAKSGIPWIVLEHEPPRGMSVGAGPGAGLLKESPAMAYSPDYLVTGHMRHAPWVSGGSWWDRRGRTIVFNAGFDASSDFPCHILLNTTRREAVWKHGRGQEFVQLDAFP